VSSAPPVTRKEREVGAVSVRVTDKEGDVIGCTASTRHDRSVSPGSSFEVKSRV
jgi:hypothetical protein